MSIPMWKLEEWKRRGADNKSKNTYEMMKKMLVKHCSDIIDVNNETVFLQGSYANHTNIKNDSDIDIVVLEDNIFANNARDVLDESQFKEFKNIYSDSDKTLELFKNKLYNKLNGKSLENSYMSFERGCKTLKFNQDSQFPNFVAVDIVPAFEFRNYQKYKGINKNNQIEGIKIYDACERDYIFNYPKLHKKNGEEKNSEIRTDGNYKETVRMFKQIKKHLLDTGEIQEDLAPSYCLECMLFNVPDAKFKLNLDKRIDSILNWLISNLSTDFDEQSKMYKLFKKSWDIENAEIFLDRCKWLSDNWS